MRFCFREERCQSVSAQFQVSFFVEAAGDTVCFTPRSLVILGNSITLDPWVLEVVQDAVRRTDLGIYLIRNRGTGEYFLFADKVYSGEDAAVLTLVDMDLIALVGRCTIPAGSDEDLEVEFLTTTIETGSTELLSEGP